MPEKRKDPKRPVPERGLGLVKCQVCGEPVADHSLTEPCPLLILGDQLTTGKNKLRGEKTL